MTKGGFPKGADVVVIGGGLSGCSAAYRLAKAGKKVVLLEMRNIASGASGRNGGQVIQLDGRDSNPDAIMKRLRYSMENNRMLAELPAELEIDFEYRRIGSLDLACSEEEWEQIQKLYKIQTAAGDKEVELLDRKALKERVPTIFDGAWGARFRRTDGNLNPFRLCHGFARAAQRYGARILTQTKAEEILFSRDAVQGVRTSRGVIECDWVLNAANAWAAKLTPELEVVPLRAVAVVTEAVPPLALFPYEAVLDGQVVYGTTQDAQGNIQVGGPPDKPRTREEQYVERVGIEEIRINTSILTRMFPHLAGINIIRSWSGAMGNTPDGLPCVGPFPGKKGLVICAGFPNGMAFVPILSRLAAEHILTGTPSMPLDQYDPGRFLGRKINWPERYNYTVLADFLARL